MEAYFQIEAARHHVDKARWPSLPDRLEGVIDWLLGALDAHRATATFFTLGFIADRLPRVMRRIAEAGHEIACHGHSHDRLHTLTPGQFAEDLRTARDAIEQATGHYVAGYRAPTFSLDRTTAWALDVLVEQGFVYDSSIQPIRRGAYGVADAPVAPHRLTTTSGAHLLELPPLVWQLGGYRLPVAGGGYFRLFPLSVMHRGIAQATRRGQPAMLYFHPWEFDPDQPRMPLGGLKQFRTYVGLRHSREKLNRLLERWPMCSVRDYLNGKRLADWPEWSLVEASRTAA